MTYADREKYRRLSRRLRAAERRLDAADAEREWLTRALTGAVSAALSQQERIAAQEGRIALLLTRLVEEQDSADWWRDGPQEEED